MCPWLFKAIVLGLSLLTLSKTESEITCPEGSEVEDAPYCASWATWCEAVNDMKLVLVCSSCEGSTAVVWIYNGMRLNDTTPQLTLLRDSVRSGCYQCSCAEQHEINFAVEARNAEKPFLMVPNRTDDGQTYLIPESRTIGLNRSSSGNITVNCTAGGWPTPKVNWSSDAVPVSSDPCTFTWDEGFVLQKIIPRRPPNNFIPYTEYTCTLYNLAGTLTAKQTIIYADTTDYFLKPAQGLITRVEVGRESYCAVYPEADSEVLYTVCLVPDADAETCPLIAHNVSDCCVCGSPECPVPGVNTSVGSTPADANWPGVPACIVQSQSAVALDCFVQRFLSEGPSLRQFTGSILYHAHNSSVPTNEGLGDNSNFIITLPFAIFGGLIAFLMVVVCAVTSICLYKKSRKNVQNASGMHVESGLGGGKKVAGAPDLANTDLENIKAKPVDEIVVSRFASRMAKQWEKIGIELNQAHLVGNLRQPNCNVESNCIQVIEAAMSSGDLPNYGVLFNALGHHGLSQVATDLLKAAVEREQIKATHTHCIIDPAAPNPTAYLTEEEDGQDTQTAEIAWSADATTNKTIGMLQVKPGTPYTLKVPPQQEEVVMKFETFGKGGAASEEGSQAAYQQTKEVALSVDGTVTKGERNEVVNRPGEVAVMVHGPQDQKLFKEVQKQQTAFIDGVKLDGKLLGLMHQYQLLTKKEFNDINAYHLRQHIPDAGTYFVNSVMFQWSLEVFESKARDLIKALEKHEDAANHKIASRLRKAFAECGLAVPRVDDDST